MNDTLQIFYATLFVSALSLAVRADEKSSTSSFVKPKQGIVESDHNAPRNYKFHQTKLSSPNARSLKNGSPKSSSYYKDVKGVPRESLVIGQPSYEGFFKQPYAGPSQSIRQSNSQLKEQSSPYFGNLFTMSAGYKVANDPVTAKQAQHQKSPIGVHGASSDTQVPVYKSNYQLPKPPAQQFYVNGFQNNPYNKVSAPIHQVQNGHQLLPNFANVQSQSLILQPIDQFNFPARTPKVNNVQMSAPFLSPFSSFQGQVVPISTTGNNPYFPQYKGAAIQVYPNIGGYSSAGYQTLQTQPQLHFGHGNIQQVQTLGGHRNLPPSQGILTDVEILNEKNPPPPKTDDTDDDDEDDEGYNPSDKEYRPNAQDDDDDDESKPDKHSNAPLMEGDFKPSISFPFKEYDDKFGKYSNQNRDEEAEEKPFTKYSDFSSSSDDNDDDTASKYHFEDTSPKPYNKAEDEEEEEDEGYENQRNEDTSEDTSRLRYIDKDMDEEYDASYRRDSPKQSYRSRSSRKNKDIYGSQDAIGQGSHTSFKYHKSPQGFKDNEGYGSDVFVFEGGFGHKIPKKIKIFSSAKGTAN
ncbi:uncharacterized protein LOC128886503 [Hylaeus anthracinus]|uniref:uncharacterized protein LOC128886503 n=1 Tax=Hylaeus anthracinus TaxID=313031 RepID=UPI0023B90778|nr:uncharacterized protein LOC128886503 [Hylaeus anthracinus]